MSSEGLGKAIDLWKKLDLPKLQKRLDYDAEQIGTKRAASDGSRKALIESTKAFQTSVDDAAKKKIRPIMKAYQSEIDKLTKRAKAAEAAFQYVFKHLIDAPDPVVLMEGAVSSSKRSAANQELEIENTRLQATIAEYHEEFANVKNQEVTITRLQDKLDEYDKQRDSAIESRAKEMEKKVQRQFDEKEGQIREEQLALVKKLGEAEQAAATMRDALDTTQSENFDLRSKYDEESAGRAAELELLQADLERSNMHVATVQKELEIERERMAELQRPSGSMPVEQAIDSMQLANFEKEITTKDKEISQLLDDYRELQETHAQLRTSMDNRIAGYEAALDARGAEKAELKAGLEGFSDYEQIKDELQMLKTIEFPGQAYGSPEDGVENLLANKSRVLDAENTELKRQSADLQGRVKQLEADNHKVSEALQQQSTLIARLEGDITAQTMGEGKETSGRTAADAALQVIPESSGQNLSGKKEDAATMLSIVSSQRDRFRSRNIELESEARQTQTTISSLRTDTDSIRADNIKLYEKIKFLQSYGGANKGGADDTVKRYSTDYEEHINPFKAFNTREKQRKYTALNPADKVALSMSRLILANSKARLIFMGYLVVIHFLIFTVLMRFSHADASRSLSSEDCMHRFANLMQHVEHDHERLFEAGK